MSQEPSLADQPAADREQTPRPIAYTLRFPAPHSHYVEVTATVPVEGGRGDVDLMMAVWTPGSYLVREFGRHVEGLRAETPTGELAYSEKTQKNRWNVLTGGRPEVVVHYRVYGREMSVRTNWIEADFAMLNGAPTFLTLADGVARPHEVTIVPAPGWTTSMTGLDALPGEHRYRARDFDTLVDSPIVIGTPAVHHFEVDGRPHALVNVGEDGVFDGVRAARDLAAIVEAHRRMWGTLPYSKYVFLNMLTEAGGGLEHANSTLLMASRWTTRTRRAYLDWLELASHEFFHTWNVKRLRPAELGPFDYERENHTRSLWVAEGFTDYYGDLLLHRAGLSSREEYLDSLSDRIEELQTAPGRHVRSADLASFDAWIKHYRPDENSANVTISYYTKGCVLAFLLDAELRRTSQGARSLDDVMRAAYEQFGGARGYTPNEFRRVAEGVAGRRLMDFWRGVHTTDELQYDEALDTFGLQFSRRREAPAARAWLGLTTRNDAGRLVIAQIRRETPAADAGLNVDDEILAIDGFRIRPDKLDQRLEQYRAGDRVTMLVARRDRLVRLEVTLGDEPAPAWRLTPVADPTPAQRQQLDAWLGRAKKD